MISIIEYYLQISWVTEEVQVVVRVVAFHGDGEEICVRLMLYSYFRPLPENNEKKGIPERGRLYSHATFTGLRHGIP
jgi:hypothetical protein